jgi:hypothetical protein
LSRPIRYSGVVIFIVGGVDANETGEDLWDPHRFVPQDAVSEVYARELRHTARGQVGHPAIGGTNVPAEDEIALAVGLRGPVVALGEGLGARV